MAADELEPAWQLQRAELLCDDVVVERRGKEGFGRGERDGGVVALVRAVHRDEHAVVRRRWRADVDHATTEREPVVLAAEVAVAFPHLSRARGPEDRRQLGIGLTEHRAAYRLGAARLHP